MIWFCPSYTATLIECRQPCRCVSISKMEFPISTDKHNTQMVFLNGFNFASHPIRDCSLSLSTNMDFMLRLPDAMAIAKFSGMFSMLFAKHICNVGAEGETIILMSENLLSLQRLVGMFVRSLWTVELPSIFVQVWWCGLQWNNLSLKAELSCQVSYSFIQQISGLTKKLSFVERT